jgi:protein O-GlcNAc transferase
MDDIGVTATSRAAPVQTGSPSGSLSEAARLLMLADQLRRTGHLADAEALCRQVLRQAPSHPEALHLLGMIALKAEKEDLAIALLRSAIAASPDRSATYCSLGSAFVAKRRLREATAAYQQAVALSPRSATAYNGLGCALVAQGRHDEAIAAYRQALSIDPSRSAIHSNLLLALQYSSAYDRAQLLAEARGWEAGDDAHAVDWTARHHNCRTPHDRIRIGYVSADFRQHSVAYLIAPVLRSHDRGQFEIFCYTNSRHHDQVTDLIRTSVEHWRHISGLPDASVYAAIKDDEIDILIDLSGHTAGNRLSVFAMKPATIQIAWLGYSGTSGVDAIDYLIADSLVIPIDGERWYTESIIRIPGSYFCYEPPEVSSDPYQLPAVRTGHITFGSFNNISKVTPEVVAAWAQILNGVTGARLCLKSAVLDDPGVRDRYTGLFAQHGVHPDRLDVLGKTSQQELFRLYNQIDIALDPFPYNGTVTSLESLWMGVPVISLEGDRFVSRVGLSILSTLGLGDLVAKSTREYVEIAAGLASRPPLLSALRAGLRSRMTGSALLDHRHFTRQLEAAYHDVWRRRCHGRAGAWA